MPTYDWKCGDNHIWELARSMGERDRPSFCPFCGKEGMRVYLKPPTLAWYPNCTRPDYKK